MAIERTFDPANFEKLTAQFLPLKDWSKLAKSSSLKERIKTGLRGDSEYAKLLEAQGVSSHMFAVSSTPNHLHAAIGAIPRHGILGTTVNGIHIIADRVGGGIRIKMLNTQEHQPIRTWGFLLLCYLLLLVPGLVLTAFLIIARRKTDARSRDVLMPLLAQVLEKA